MAERSGRFGRWHGLLLVGFVLFAVALTLAVSGLSLSEANFSTYRFAQNVRTGRGLVFDAVGSEITTFPLAPLVLALVAGPGNLALGGALVAGVAAGVAAWLLTLLASGQIVAGLALVGALCIQPSPVIALMFALALAAIEYARLERWRVAGALVGLASLAAPQAIIPAILLLALAYRQPGAVWKYALPAALIPALGLVALLGWTGARDVVSLVPTGWPLALAALAALVLLWKLWRGERLPATTALLIAWSTAEALLALVTGSAPTAAFAPGAILAVLALSQGTATPTAPRRAAVALIVIAAVTVDALLSLGGVARPSASISGQADVEAGQWIAANTPDDATVATDRIGALALVVGRSIHDLSGRLGGAPPDPFFIAREAPDIVVDQPGLAGRESLEPGLAAFYSPVSDIEPLTIYRRDTTLAPVDEHPVDVNFSATLGRDDLRLVGVGIGDTLHPGDLVRVRLDWQLAHVPGFDVQIKLDLLTPEFAGLGGATDDLPPERWRAGTMRTYHAFVVSPDAAPGPASLYINVGIRAATMGIVKIADVQVAAGE
jgi:hypothetical protein